MRAEALAFVQFIHPGGEHREAEGAIKRWNRDAHRRKFMLADADYLVKEHKKHGRVALWGEWEPPSRVVARFGRNGDLPEFLHEPLLEEQHDYSGLQNTDPYVFGDRFLYTGCQQFTNHGRTETQLRRLQPGSVILFGSCRDTTRFVIDTVFVVSDHRDHTLQDHGSTLRDFVTDPYWTVTLRPWYSGGDSTASFRLYRGATLGDPVEGMFSFAPCRPVDRDPRFARPKIDLPQVTSHLKQGRRLTHLASIGEATALWRQVRDQVLDQGLGLAYHLDAPRESTSDPLCGSAHGGSSAFSC